MSLRTTLGFLINCCVELDFVNFFIIIELNPQCIIDSET